MRNSAGETAGLEGCCGIAEILFFVRTAHAEGTVQEHCCGAETGSVLTKVVVISCILLHIDSKVLG